MPELIDKHAAYNALKHEAETHGLSFSAEAYDRAARIIDQMHTIEPEVRHGRWIQSDALDYKDPNGVIHVHGMCSCCRLIYDFRDMTSRFKFCPNCGAKMDGGADNG